MENQELKKIIKDLYRCRLENDAEGCLKHFSKEGILRLAGIPLHPSCSCSEFLTDLVEKWSFNQVEGLEILGEGPKVATRYRVNATFNPTKEEVDVEVADWITFDENNQVIELVQHLDTALLLKVSGELR